MDTPSLHLAIGLFWGAAIALAAVAVGVEYAGMFALAVITVIALLARRAAQ